MALRTHIFNMALSHLGIGREVSDPDTDPSQEAQACRRFYHEARKATLRDFEWPFATKQVALALVANNPTCQWKFSYQVPSDCLHFRKILSGLRNDTRQSRVTYRIFNSPTGKLIYTNRCNAQGEYTVDVTQESLFDPDFDIALSFRMAMYMAPRLTKGDPFKLGDRAAQMYTAEISKARASAVNEEQEYQDPESEFVRTRGGFVDGRERGEYDVDFPAGFTVD